MASTWTSLIWRWWDMTSATRRALVAAQQPVVDEDAGELIADGPVHQGRRHRRVDPAREGAEDAAVSHPGADVGHRPLHEGARLPGRRAPADTGQEVGQELLAGRGVDHLGMELDAVAPHRSGEGGVGRVERVSDGAEPLGQPGDDVAMGHPDRGLGGDALEDPRRVVDVELGGAVLAPAGRLHDSRPGHGRGAASRSRSRGWAGRARRWPGRDGAPPARTPRPARR